MVAIDNKECKFVRFQVLTAASMKLRIFWDVLPYCRPDDGGNTYL
jgi:hypothetical protein